MSDIIHLLPDSVANQIAAGEVIQRPSSAVKELMENALDAGATEIQVIIKDAGKTLIQVIDDGKGMSETDARMAFERHATSKIKSANDLYSLQTMGFRGEALASIAAIAQVELRTKRPEDELGTLIEIGASNVQKQEVITCCNGSNFSVRNLFYNIPVRRNFLKKAATEFGHILTEFNRIAIIYPHISFSLKHNDETVSLLEKSSLRQRIIDIFGKNINKQLIPIENKTSLMEITGFVGKPEVARKQAHNQYFFVNGRYMRHPYFHRAVMQAYDRMLQPETTPCYFINFDIDPSSIDVNIHPTKTEIKFENEQAIWSIIYASVKEALGKFSVLPALDFDQERTMDIPVLTSSVDIKTPQVDFNPSYNPFKQSNSSYDATPKKQNFDWEKLYESFESGDDDSQEAVQTTITLESGISSSEAEKTSPIEQRESVSNEYFQFKKRYILTAVKSGLMFIDQHRAHTRVLFEQYLSSIQKQKGASQQMLFPELIDLSAEELIVFEDIKDDLAFVGFDLDCFGKSTYRINGIPSNLEGKDCVSLIKEIIQFCRSTAMDSKTGLQEQLALSLANAAAIPYGKVLSDQEMNNLINMLFACANYNYSPDGKPIAHILSEAEIENRF